MEIEINKLSEKRPCKGFPGAAAGATIGRVSGGYEADEARREIVADLNQKSMQNKAIDSGNLAHGFVFFSGEATSA